MVCSDVSERVFPEPVRRVNGNDDGFKSANLVPGGAYRRLPRKAFPKSHTNI